MVRKIINDPFLLIESDLVFDESLLEGMLYPDRMAVARMHQWMNGTTVTVNRFQDVTRFHNGAEPLDETRYKTVNIYSLSLYSWHGVAERLDRYISTGRVNHYYEAVFAEMAADGDLSFQAISFDGKPWYEIDTISDLKEAEKLFSAPRYGATVSYNFAARTPDVSMPFIQQPTSRPTERIPDSSYALPA